MIETSPNPVITEHAPSSAAQTPAQATSHALFHLMPSLTDAAFIIPLLFLFSKLDGVRTMLGDGDTGWHIRTGEWILANHRIPHQDMFSFTMPNQPWFAWEWLWDVTFAWIHAHGGLGSVVAVSMVIMCLAFALLYRLILRRCGNPIVAIGLTAMAAAGSSIHWLARPHLFTALFMVIFLAVLDRVHDGRTRLLWLLPAIMIPWTNIHGGFFIGIILVGTYAGGELLRAAFATSREERLASAKASLPYIYTVAGCALATLVNPYTYHLHQHILKYLNDPFQTTYILEFQSTNFRMGAAGFLEAMLALGLGAAVWYGRRKQFTEVLTIVGWGHLSLIIVRNMPIFMLAAAPVVALPLTIWLKALSEAPIAGWLRRVFAAPEAIGEEIAPMERPWRLHVFPAVVMVLLFLAIQSPNAGKKLKPEYDPERYPAGALALLQQPGQRIFTHDEWGDYLLYHLWPKGVKVFVDGRSDFYGPVFGQAYIDILNVKYDWEQTLAKYGVNTILMPVDAPLTGALKESRKWRVVYDDTRAIVFRKIGGSAETVSTSGIGGGERDLSIAVSPNVYPEDHEFHSKGALN
jgi:hypothetical protein